MKDDKKSRILFIRLIYACIAAALAAAAAAAFLPSVKSVMLTVVAVSCAAAAFLLHGLFGSMEKRIENAETIGENTEGYALIRYCKKNETAVISGDFTRVTGLDIEDRVLDETDYKKLVIDMISYPSDAGADIYMAARPESWIRIRTYENDEFEYTMIHNVSEFVSCKNIIKSLKYYDSETGLLCRDAFISKVRSAADAKPGTVGMVTLLISGVDKLTSFKGTAAADKAISKASSFVKKFENPHNIFAGRTATNEFCILITDTYDDGCRKYAEKLYEGLTQTLDAMDSGEYIRVYCGYALFDEEENTAEAMMSAVDYAAFEAKTSAASEPVAFDRANYVIRAYDFKKIQVFNSIINENRVHYFFQPVVDAHTGAVFGYEALMRPEEIDGIKLSPPETVEIGKQQAMSTAVEYMTLLNTMRFLSENRSRFDEKKLFINTIPNCFISDEKYNELYSAYGDIFDKLIIEITEGVQITRESIDVLQSRYSSKGALVAMDDYGTGYANESTLISIKPDFIKVDRSLIEAISSDIRKKHLVANIISFAKSHNIKIIAEGVETSDELEAVITLGADLIQGFYTSRPAPTLTEDIPAEIKDEILGINLKNVGYTRKIYRLDTDEPKDVAELAIQGYTDIFVENENVTLIGSTAHSASMRIVCEDGYSGRINIKNVNIFGLEAPVLTLGKNCEVTLEAEGKNFFSYEGIRVPESSRFVLGGSGQLNIDMSSDNGVIIGGSFMQDFGSIEVNMEGSLNITAKSGNIVAVGGGFGGGNSAIGIFGGLITAELKGVLTLGIGAVSGKVGIKIDNSNIDLSVSSQNAIAIGSKSGSVNIDCRSAITASCAGDNCCTVGTLENGNGSIVMRNGKYDLTIHSKNGVCIGSMGGKTDIDIKDGVYNLFSEGNNAVGIGDAFGEGSVTVSDGLFRMHVAASAELPIGLKNGKTVIRGGNIITDSNEKINAESPFGEPLEEVRTECAGKFSEKISSKGKEYVYNAPAAEGESFVNIYLPAGYALK